jgi:AraC-like DNA-binding protein
MTEMLAITESDGFETRRFRYEGNHVMEPHVHEHGQLTWITAGVLSQVTASGMWVAPRQRLIWMPPGVQHGAQSRGVVEGWLVLTPAYFAEHLPARVCVLRTSQLLTTALERLTERAATSHLAALLAPVILFELGQTAVEELGVPLPREATLRAVAQTVIEAPADPRGIDAWARAALMSTRSFTRHFEAETGMPFSEWKRRVVARRAVELLASGESVANVAAVLGYESVSAFIAMFKRLHGMPPSRFVAATLN